MKKDEFVKQLSELVSFKTVTKNFEENKSALDYVVSLLDSKLKIDRKESNGFEYLIASVKGASKPKYSYMVHIDVVFGEEVQFVMKLDGSKAIGRGTSDMKFSIPIGIALINEAVNKGIDMDLVITTDEEIGGFDGGKVISGLGYCPEILIVPDGGDNLSFVEKAKGVCQLKLTSKGIPAHASRPWMGKNAIDSLVVVANKLLENYGKNSLAENWNTTMCIGTVEGGISTNQVCPSAEMKIDFRYPESDSIENIQTGVEKIIKDFNFDIKVEKLSTGLPTFTDVNSDEVKEYLGIMEKAFGKKLDVKQTYGASDARHFPNSIVLMNKPMGGEIHSETEWVDIDSCMSFYEGLQKYLGLI
jgi:succinyl-diaminopimelate desuccinylase